jgi:hypothetical protein
MPGIEEDVDLNELVAEIVADANFETEGTGRAIIWNNGAPAVLHGRPDILRVAVENAETPAGCYASREGTALSFDPVGKRRLFGVQAVEIHLLR